MLSWVQNSAFIQLALKGGHKPRYCTVPPSPGSGSSVVLLQSLLKTGNNLFPKQQSPRWIAGGNHVPRSFRPLGISDLYPSLVLTDLIYRILTSWLGFSLGKNNPNKKLHMHPCVRHKYILIYIYIYVRSAVDSFRCKPCIQIRVTHSMHSLNFYSPTLKRNDLKIFL